MHGFKTVQLSDGRTLAYSDAGDPAGFPLFHFHGIPTCRLEHHAYPGVPEDAGVRLICPDRPGLGRSDRKRGRRVADWAADVAELADALGIDHFAVNGYSAGGPYALACAHALTERVTGVGVMAGMSPPAIPGGYRDASSKDRLMLKLSRFAPLIAAVPWHPAGWMARRHPGAFVREMAKELPAAPDRAALAGPLAELFPDVYLETVQAGVAGIVDDYRALGRDWGFALEELKVPVRWLHGGLDETVPLRHGRWTADRIPNAELIVAADAGHILPSEAVLELWREIGQFAARDMPAGRCSTAAPVLR